VDFDVWVELIPFQETRRYTKRVLASRATYAFLYAQGAPEEALRLPMTLAPSAPSTGTPVEAVRKQSAR
jgi:soluble lytic murein transglycosylase